MATNRVRVASLQYYIRPVKSFEDFEQQVSALVETARDYRVKLLTFPEYYSIQLLTLGDIGRPIEEQVRNLASQESRIVEMMSKLAEKFGIYIVGGSVPSLDEETGQLRNRSYVYSSDGSYDVQSKLHMTRFEKEEWLIEPGNRLRIFEAPFGKFAVAICYDVEFPEIARAAARLGAQILVVPSCTDDRQGYLRVRYCAQARAIENQMYVIHSPTVGSLPMVPAVSLNYGAAAIYTPSDYEFSRDGILAEGTVNQESMIIGDLNLDLINEARESGTVLPLRDSISTQEMLNVVDHVKLP
ncbi:MAG: acyltransferase [Bdellovibrionaceae bacterium]|nr:acyltransferase [Pseudobdellovibrionaceae bacterium]|tara:strand:- start:278542 stop:279438 length:897 start_codon:yes stop_codon:yes gene_type:complete